MHLCVIFTKAVCCCVFIFLSCLKISSARTEPDTGRREKVGKIKGTIVLGGIFRISRKEDKNRCAEAVEVEVGIQRAEAMVYAIQEVNKDPNLLPNVTLGMEIRDSCNQETVALDETLKFILDSLSMRASSRATGNCIGNASKDVVGVVGASRSSISIEVANLLRLFKVPQVSYASTSAELSNVNKYSYFARTVPPDTLQALAMLHVVEWFKWKSVFTVNSAGSYGEKGIEQFRRQANSSICIVAAEQVTDDDSSADYDRIIDKFAKLSKTTHVVVLFMKDNHVKKLLKSAMVKNYSNVTWIASDEWGTRHDIVENLGDYLEKSNAITITLPSLPLHKFETYFKGLNGTENRDANPWFAQYWKQHCNTTCNTTNSYSSDYKFNDKLPYVVDAVYTFAHALHKIYKEKCPQMTGLCDNMKPVDGTELRDQVFNVSFKGNSGDVAFDKNGDSKGKYDVFHYCGRQDGYKLLGVWQDQFELMNNRTTRLEKVKSTCSEECPAWSTKLPKDDTPCCYKCVNCKEHQYVDDITCVDCAEHERPNGNYSGCEDLPHRYIPIAWVIIVSVFAALGIISTLIVFILFLYNVNTPLVKASGRDLIFPLLIGVLLCFIMTPFLVSKPTLVICTIQRFGIGFSFSMCYASILIKTNRIARIFANHKLKSVNFTKPHTQWVMLALLIGVEVCLASVGLMMKLPKVVKILPTANDILVKCDITHYDYIITFSYNFLLVILCTIYSFRTRTIPSSFNEARYLGFVMYTTCIIWIAFLPVYYGTEENYHPIALSLNASLNATTILVCLFGPKIYIIVFRPSRNIQSPLSIATSHSRSMVDITPGVIPGNLGNASNANTMVGIDCTNASADETTSKDQSSPNVDCSDENANCDATAGRASDCSISEDVNSQDENSVTTQ